MRYNPQILGIDCAPLKNRHYDGQQMVLVGRDGNCNNLTIAVALVNAEDVENYTWFIQCLQGAGISIADYPVVCNRSDSFRSVAQTFGISARYCTLPIIHELLDKFKTITDAGRNVILQLQEAKFDERYNACLAQIGKDFGVDVETYLRAIPPEKWVLFPAVGVRPLYGWRTTNFVESASGVTLLDGLQEKAPYEFLDGVMAAMVKSVALRSQQARSWAEINRYVTPGAQALYERQHLRMGACAVTVLSPGVANVEKVGQVPSFCYHVDLALNRCSCAFMNQFGIPCRHMIATLARVGAMESVYSRFAPCYKVANYVSVFNAGDEEISAGYEPDPMPLLQVPA